MIVKVSYRLIERLPVGLLLLLAVSILAGCKKGDALTPTTLPTRAPTSTPTQAPTPTPVPTATPTPLPAILRVPLMEYVAPNDAFKIQVPELWAASQVPGGVRFEDVEGDVAAIAYFQPLPVTVDGAAYVTGVVSATLAAVELNDAAEFRVLQDEVTDEGRRRVEFEGRLEPDKPPSHVLAELWSEGGALLGLSLEAPRESWEQYEPLWPLLLQSYAPRPVAETLAGMAEAYVHSSGYFTVTVPVGWGVLAEEEDGALFGDESGLAQFAITAAEFDRLPQNNEVAEALASMLGDLPEQAGYEELAREELSPNGFMVRFEALTETDGFARTELRAFAVGNVLFTTSFSASPQDWELFEPAYEMLLGSLETQAPPLDEATLAENPVAGIQVGEVMFYRARGGAVWVSAAIHNRRPRNIGELTAAVQLFDEEDNLIAAESWLMEQRILPAGGVTYLTMRIAKDVAPRLDKVSYAGVQVVYARETKKKAPRSWSYVGGKAKVNENGDVVLDFTLRNAGKQVRRRVYAVALLYDSEGKLVFARAETKILPYATPPGAEVDLRLIVWGPFSDLATFDVIGEVPK